MLSSNDLYETIVRIIRIHIRYDYEDKIVIYAFGHVLLPKSNSTQVSTIIIY